MDELAQRDQPSREISHIPPLELADNWRASTTLAAYGSSKALCSDASRDDSTPVLRTTDNWHSTALPSSNHTRVSIKPSTN